MIKILHTADWHLGKRLQEFSRIEEQKQVLEEISEIADKEKVDLILLAGDIFDTFNPSHEAVELLYKSLRKLSKNGTRPIVAISGNHDSTQFISAPDPLARELGIFFYSKQDQSLQPGRLESGVAIENSEPGFIEISLPAHPFPIRILLAPYANELLLKTYLGEEGKEEELRNILRDKWQFLADKYCNDLGINLFMGHFFFMKEGERPGEEPESEKPILHIGGAQALYSNTIPNGIQYAALGHLHRFQVIDREPCPVVYCSSPLAYSFSEADQEKKVVIIEASPAQPVLFYPITLTKGRPLFRKKFEQLEIALDWLNNNPHCFLELTYCTDEAIDASTRRALMKAHDGIVSLIPQIRNADLETNQALTAADLEQDMVTLFSRFYKTNKGMLPNDDIMDIFKEIISQKED